MTDTKDACDETPAELENDQALAFSQETIDLTRESISPVEDSPALQTSRKYHLRRSHAVWAVVMLVIYLLGLGSGYGLWGLPTPEENAAMNQEKQMTETMA